MVCVKYCHMDDTESVRVPEKYQPLCIIITYYKELSEDEIALKEHSAGVRNIPLLCVVVRELIL